MILKNLKWSNWFSYGEGNYIDFEKSTLTQVLGKNGTGKSSIIHILEEVLYNKNSKGFKKADLMNRDKKSLSAVLKFNVDNIAYTIKIDRKSSAKVSLYKEDEDISSHTATNTFKDIQKIIGLDFQTFTQLVYQNSKQGLEFLISPDSARKKFLISLFKLDRYTEYYDIFKKAFNEINLASKELEGKKSILQDWLIDHKNQDFSIKQLKPILDDKALHEMLSDIKNLQDKKENIEAENRLISKNNKAIEDLKRAYKPTHPLPDEPIRDDNLESNRITITKEINYNNKLIRDLQNLKNAKCNTCLQTIDTNIKDRMILDTKNKLKKQLAQLDTIIETRDLYKTKLSEYRELKKSYLEYNLLESNIDNTINTDLYISSDIDIEIDLIREKYNILKDNIVEINKYNKKVNENNAKVETILIEMTKNEKTLKDVKDKLDNIITTKAKLDILKTIFSTKGLVSYKIDFLVKDLQDKINEYLISLSDGRFQLNFILQNDSINIGIIDNGVSVNITALSTGELSRVNVATLLAIRYLISSLSNTKINLLYLDEVLGVLDSTGKANLIDILLKERDLNTFIISHEYSHPLLEKLYISKTKEGSIIE